MRLYTEGCLIWEEACDLMDDLKRSGIDCNVTAGAIAINANALEEDGTVSYWDDWDEDRQVDWLERVSKVVNGRCSYSSALPLHDQLVVDRPAAIARLKGLGFNIK